MPASKQPLTPPILTNHPVDVGHRTEAAIIYFLITRGYSVSIPLGVNQRYDLIIDLDGRLIRAQCKTGRLQNGSIIFRTSSVVTSKTKNVVRGYHGEADVFLVRCPEVDHVYWVPVETATGGSMYLRVDPCLNGQRQRVNWASDYALPG